MKTIPERLADLRAAMAEAGCDAYLLPSSDPHANEYAPEYFTAWIYFSGFSCENATLVVTAQEAAMWVDGRFFGAADAALEGTGIQSMHMGVKGVPELYGWIKNALAAGMTLGYTAANMPLGKKRELEKKLDGTGIVLKAAFCDDEAWKEGRPPLPKSKAWILEKQYAGLDIREKLDAFRGKADGWDCAVLTELGNIAWLLNLRADDIENTPYALAFCYVSPNGAELFIDESRVPDEARGELASAGVELKPYESFPEFLRGLTEPVRVLIDPKAMNAALYNSLAENPACTVVEGEDPIGLMKAVKNDVELACTAKCHIADGVAMVRFEKELEERLAAGEILRETDIAEILLRYRSRDPFFIEESFSTIAAYGANAAMMHYAPVAGNDSAIEKKGFLLVDCGGTYYTGTTDITRTYAMGELTDKERELYTVTLKAHIDVASAMWPEGMMGRQLDMYARRPFWERKLDYRCGTGHSVSHVGSVHEGPHALNNRNNVVFKPGMIITDEPGYYEDGVTGMRIENELVCMEAGESEYGNYLLFEPITFVPIDTRPVITAMLSKEELNWLNSYHAAVLAKLSPELTDEEIAWLKNKCAPIGK